MLIPSYEHIYVCEDFTVKTVDSKLSVGCRRARMRQRSAVQAPCGQVHWMGPPSCWQPLTRWVYQQSRLQMVGYCQHCARWTLGSNSKEILLFTLLYYNL